MKSIVLMTVIVFWANLVSVSAQNSTMDILCSSIDEKVVAPLKPVKMLREKVYTNDCVFSFSIEGTLRVRLYVEKYQSRGESLRELESLKESFARHNALLAGEAYRPKQNFKNIDPRGYWDKAVAYRNRSENFALLHRDKYLIIIMSNDFSLVQQTEGLLRTVSF